MKLPPIYSVEINYNLPCILFFVEQNQSYYNTLKHSGISFSDYAKYSCLRWARERGITRLELSDLKISDRNDAKRFMHIPAIVVSARLEKGEEVMIKLHGGEIS